MELMINFVLGTISTVLIGLVTNYFWDKVKSHSSSSDRKSGIEFDINIRFKFKK